MQTLWGEGGRSVRDWDPLMITHQMKAKQGRITKKIQLAKTPDQIHQMQKLGFLA